MSLLFIHTCESEISFFGFAPQLTGLFVTGGSANNYLLSPKRPTGTIIYQHTQETSVSALL